jgi:alcohol dehydrogenase class IV
MGISVILTIVCLAHNIESYIQSVRKHITAFFGETGINTIKDMQIWLCFI